MQQSGQANRVLRTDTSRLTRHHMRISIAKGLRSAVPGSLAGRHLAGGGQEITLGQSPAKSPVRNERLVRAGGAASNG